MEHPLDVLARALAVERSRRQTLKLLVGAALGAVAGSRRVEPGTAQTCIGFKQRCSFHSQVCCEHLTCSVDEHICVCNELDGYTECRLTNGTLLSCCDPGTCCLADRGCIPGGACGGGCCPSLGFNETACQNGVCTCTATGAPRCMGVRDEVGHCCGADEHCCFGQCCANGVTCDMQRGCICANGGKQCRGAPGNCCAPGQICLSTIGRQADGTEKEFSVCCGTDEHACPPTDSKSPTQCCARGSECLTTPTLIGGSCCPIGYHACPNTTACCPPEAACGTDDSRRCVCPAGRRLCAGTNGFVCCPSDAFCDFNKDRCVCQATGQSPTTCGDGQTRCCPTGATCPGSVCVCPPQTIACHDGSGALTGCCKSNETCQAGVCTPCPNGEVSCHQARICCPKYATCAEGAACVCRQSFTPCFGSAGLGGCCAADEVCHNGQCSTCPAGQHRCGSGPFASCCAVGHCCENGRCVAKCSHGCCSGGTCVASCPACMGCDPARGVCSHCGSLGLCCASDGTCVKASACPNGGCCIGGSCGCPAGQYCQDGSCLCDGSGQPPMNGQCLAACDANHPCSAIDTCCAGGVCLPAGQCPNGGCCSNGVCGCPSGATCRSGRCICTSTGQPPVNGQCAACDAVTCSGGCCDPANGCLPVASQTPAGLCGSNGATCGFCPHGANCQNGQCICPNGSRPVNDTCPCPEGSATCSNIGGIEFCCPANVTCFAGTCVCPPDGRGAPGWCHLGPPPTVDVCCDQQSTCITGGCCPLTQLCCDNGFFDIATNGSDSGACRSCCKPGETCCAGQGVRQSACCPPGYTCTAPGICDSGAPPPACSGTCATTADCAFAGFCQCLGGECIEPLF